LFSSIKCQTIFSFSILTVKFTMEPHKNMIKLSGITLIFRVNTNLHLNYFDLMKFCKFLKSWQIFFPNKMCICIFVVVCLCMWHSDGNQNKTRVSSLDQWECDVTISKYSSKLIFWLRQKTMDSLLVSWY
jgi:hypothetical protein